MLDRIIAAEYVAAVGNGRTKPLHLVCDKADGSTVEVIAKFSANCEEGVINLARETIAACLAADLGLPIPVPYLVEIPPDFPDIVPDVSRRDKIKASAQFAFGSTFVTGQYSAWVTGGKISEALVPTAAAVFAFDAIVGNPDRRDTNPNCLVKGDELRIFDHELCFMDALMLPFLRPPPPWKLGGVKPFETPGNHIFRAGLRGRPLDFTDVRSRWKGLSDARLMAYEGSIPTEWAAAGQAVKASLNLVRDARDNIDGCIAEIQRVLT